MSYFTIKGVLSRTIAASAFAGLIFSSTGAFAEPLGYASTINRQSPAFERMMPSEAALHQALPDEDAVALPSRLRRQVVEFSGHEAAGSIIIDTRNTYLYYVLGNGKALRYGIGVGREGFTWSGTQSISRKAEWPDWSPARRKALSMPLLCPMPGRRRRRRWPEAPRPRQLCASAVPGRPRTSRRWGTGVPRARSKLSS